MKDKHCKLQILSLFEDDLSEIADDFTHRLQNPIAAGALVDAVETAIEERRSCAEAFEVYPPVRERHLN